MASNLSDSNRPDVADRSAFRAMVRDIGKRRRQEPAEDPDEAAPDDPDDEAS
jgi:hypothetical protein